MRAAGRRIVLAALLAVVMPTAARAEWIEATTPHFRVLANSDAKAITAYATKLEKFDKALRLIRDMPNDPAAGSNRLTVYVVSSPREVQRLHGPDRSLVYGFYVPRAARSVAFTPGRSTGSGKWTLDPETVLFHEYTHHFMLQNFAAAYPRWFSEGFAEFNSTANVLPDGTVWIGGAANHRAYGLARFPMKTADLLSADRSRLDANRTEALYGHGWLLTHMLTFEPSRKGQLNAYLDEINRGTPSLAAGMKAFGDLKELDKDLGRYLSRRRISALKFSPEQLPIGTPTVRRLSAGEAALMPVRLQSDRGVLGATKAREVAAEARKLAAPFPDDAGAQGALAEAEYDADNLDAANAAADRVLKADPKSFQALIYKGRVAVDIATRDKADNAGWKAARQWFIRANAIDNNDAAALWLFFLSFRAQGKPPTANAIAALRQAFALAPQDEGLRWATMRQYLEEGDVKAARRLLMPLAYDPHADPETSAAARLLARFDANDPAKRLLELADTLVNPDKAASAA
jgi:tetratricopeptide (TPR) repeat protein